MAIGDSITFDMVATVQGANATTADDGLVSISGALESLLPDWTQARGSYTATRAPQFSGPGSSDGQPLDMGNGQVNVQGADWNSFDGFFIARATGSPDPAPGAVFTIGHGTFTLNAVTSAVGGMAQLYFNPQFSPTVAAWHEDGQLLDPSNGGLWSGNVINVQAIPEPISAVALAAVASFASALRPRRKDSW